MKINIDNLEVKYLIGNYKDMSSYPTPKDVVYTILQWMISDNKKDDDIFSDNFMSKLLGKNLDDTKKILQETIKEGYIEHVKDTNTKSIFKMVKNPFK